MRILPAVLSLGAVLALSGCATQQVRFQPWAGIPEAEAQALRRGELAAAPSAVFDAAAITLEHEPYLHWSIQSLDKANGFLSASAGLLREVQLRVAPLEGGGSRLGVNVPRRELKARAKVWVKDDGYRTAYEPPLAERGAYRVVSAQAVLDADYFRSFVWRALHDRSQVPFDLAPLGGEGGP